MEYEIKDNLVTSLQKAISLQPASAYARPDYIPTRSALVSVIIPTLNEARNLPLVLPFLPMDWVDEVILVDGRSTDGTVEIARQLLPSIKVVLEERRGKGVALQSGYDAAIGDILVVLDADGSHDPREIPRYIKPLLEGADMVKGSRFASGGGTTDMPRFRKLGNFGFVLISNYLFSTHYTDLCYGFHAFWRYCLDSLSLEEASGFEIDTSLYLQAVRKRLKVVEAPSFEGCRFHGMGKLKTFPDGWRVLKTIAKEWLASRREPQPELHFGFRGIPFPATFSGLGPSSQANRQFLPLFDLMLMVGINPNDVFQRILRTTLDSVQAASGSILVLDGEGKVKDATLAYGNEMSQSSAEDVTNLLENGLAGWVLKHRQVALVPNTQADPRWLKRSWDETGHSRSAMVIPLVFGKELAGVLTLVRPQVRQFTESDLEHLQKIAIEARP